MATPQHIVLLLERVLQREALTLSEQQELKQWFSSGRSDDAVLADPDWNKELIDYLSFIQNKTELDIALTQFSSKAGLPEAETISTSMEATPSIHRVHFLRTAWFRYAAMLLLIAGTALYLYNASSFRKPPEVAQLQQPQDIQPGGNKANLTLADGSIIILESAASGALTNQGTTQILKLDSGTLSYKSGAPKGEVGYNTVSTPKGGQYQIVLPDGSRVWLNAASSIRFPTAFGKERRVEVSGEVYLEVALNKTAPFFVKAGGDEIAVLGTSFNVNAYPDEKAAKTSLVEGRIRIGSTILKPGQAYQEGQVKETNIEQDLAWKHGAFNFRDMDLAVVFRQLGRWYDVDIQYEGKMPDKSLRGRMGRDLNLSQVLRALKGMGINTKLEGKTLLILQD